MNGESTKRPAQQTLPPRVARAIEEVLWFYWEEQQDAFIADQPEPGEDHTFRHLVAIDQWFYGHEDSAEDFVRMLDDTSIEAARQRVKSFRG